MSAALGLEEPEKKDRDNSRQPAIKSYSLPLYQIYSSAVQAQARHVLIQHNKLSATELRLWEDKVADKAHPLWRNNLQVRTSGVLKDLAEKELKRQEALYEVFTSEESYVKSLQVYVGFYMKHMMNFFVQGGWLDRSKYEALSIHMNPVLELSAKFARALATLFECDIMMTGLAGIFDEHITVSSRWYLDYAKHYLKKKSVYEQLCQRNENVRIVMRSLSKEPRAQRQPLESFFILPIQRITRYPLLVDAVLKYTDDEDPSYSCWVSLRESLQRVT